MDKSRPSKIKRIRCFIHQKTKNLFLFALKSGLSPQQYAKMSYIFDYFFERKEISLTRKYIARISARPRKNRITVAFMVVNPATWNSLRAVYEAMASNPLFQIYLVAQPDLRDPEGRNPAYALLSSLYSAVINAFEHQKWFDITAVSPDYVFYSYPYEHAYYEAYKAREMRKYAKICLIQYGYNFEQDATFYISHNFNFLKNVALFFAANETIQQCLKPLFRSLTSPYPRLLHLGYPLFDWDPPASQTSDRPCILWTPRWTSSAQKGNKQSHFIDYYRSFLSFARQHPEVTLIIRPHPLMFSNFLETGVMTQDQIDAFKAQCRESPNIELDEQADYFPGISRASAIVSDFSALLAEYFVLNKPVIYCDGHRGFSKEALIMDASLYHARSWEEIERRLLQLLSGHDEMKEKRLQALKQFLPEGRGSIAERIVESIKEDHYGA